jgi:hypothetical protein
VNVPRDSTNQPLETIALDVNVIELTAEELKALGFELQSDVR